MQITLFSFIFRPPGLLATPGPSHRGSCFRAAAAVASASEQNTGRCLPVHRIGQPSEPGN